MPTFSLSKIALLLLVCFSPLFSLVRFQLRVPSLSLCVFCRGESEINKRENKKGLNRKTLLKFAHLVTN